MTAPPDAALGGGEPGPPPKPTVAELVRDLADEHAALDALVARLEAADFARPTPSPGWSVADQVGHLTYFDRTGAVAIADPEAFAAEVADLLEAVGRGEDPMTAALEASRRLGPDELVASWRAARAGLLAAAGRLADGDRLPWYGPSMSAASFLTARLMETWAHGQDVADALGAERPVTDRLRHIAQLGVITRTWSYTVRGEPAPSEPVRVRLAAPSGATWQWQADATSSIAGPAEDFCLVVTQRRNVADTALRVEGEAAASWLAVAQAFAGAPTTGPAPAGASEPTA